MFQGFDLETFETLQLGFLGVQFFPCLGTGREWQSGTKVPTFLRSQGFKGNASDSLREL
jgi:hypothetical protein